MLGVSSALCLLCGFCGLALGWVLVFPPVDTLSAFFGLFFGGVLALDDDPDLVPLMALALASSFPFGVFLEPLTVVFGELLADFPAFGSFLVCCLDLVEPEEPEEPATEGMISPCAIVCHGYLLLGQFLSQSDIFNL